MNHVSFNTILRYFEDELLAEEKQEVERHLAECVMCRRILEEQKAVELTAKKLPDEQVSSMFTAQIMTKVLIRRKESVFYTVMRPLMNAVGIGLTLAFSGLVLYLIFRMIGTVQSKGISSGKNPAGISTKITEFFSSFGGQIADFLRTFSPFQGIEIITLTFIALVILFLFDRYLARKTGFGRKFV